MTNQSYNETFTGKNRYNVTFTGKSRYNETFTGNSHRYNDAEATIIIIAMLVMVVASLFGNVLTIVAYFKVKSLRRATNYFILSLAVADSIVVVFVVNFHTMYMIIDWPYHTLNYHVCLFWLTVDYWVFQVSVFGVLLIAGDRYLSIKFPHRYRRWRSDNIVIGIIAGKWVLAFLIWVPLILAYGSTKGTEGEMVEQEVCDVGSSKVIPATVIGCLVSYVVPVFLMMIIAIDSVLILLKMKRRFSKTTQTKLTQNEQSLDDITESQTNCGITDPGSDPGINPGTSPGMAVAAIHTTAVQRCGSIPETEEVDTRVMPAHVQTSSHFPSLQRKKKKSKLTKRSSTIRFQSFSNSLDEYQWIATFNMLLGIAFVINVFPFGILAVTRSICLNISGTSCVVSTKWWYFGYIMCYMNSMLNPLCYAFGNKNFKKAFKKILCGKTAMNRNSAPSFDTVDSRRSRSSMHSLDNTIN